MVLGHSCSTCWVNACPQQSHFWPSHVQSIIVFDLALCKSPEGIRLQDYMTTALQKFDGRQIEN